MRTQVFMYCTYTIELKVTARLLEGRHITKRIPRDSTEDPLA